ncbi:DUF3320 domain-containing protein [Methanolobus psychrotolerans]|uniref:DUF3320 domain-containing protein n=1 Tax=Methanolobus psychrotolerans TaxID=1874706 RepID=UPI000B91CC44|nr:DUF3320 domain-containing protein [Methanolobus psychrotolerans]
MSIVKKELEVARHNLLDLTMRNSLLNFHASKTREIRVVDEIPKEVYDRLVLQEKKMEFHPKSKNQDKKYDTFVDESKPDMPNEDIDDDESSILWKMSPPNGELESKHIDRFLQTTLKNDDLQKRMYYISQQSQSVFEEQGYTVLYLALGFLEWEDPTDTSKIRQAPLILIPVELVRTMAGGSFQLSWTGEDIFTNVSLQAKLIDDGISLPEFEMPDEKEKIDQYYQDVVEAIAKKTNWNVLSDISLGFFSFTKFVMYKDLDPMAWPENSSPAKHPLIKCIFDPDTQICETEFSEDDVDKKVNARNVYHVMDADPSQIAVIEDVKSGMSMVVEGPPGTGKSQTITNIIAELLAAGKSVLFVSEKMAALEVVKSRLDQVGLGDFCLELHSRKANKKELLKELERTVSLAPPKSVSLDNHFDKLESLKAELNDYANALREPFGYIKQSPFNLFCMKEGALRHFESVGREMAKIKYSNIEKCSQKEWTESISTLSNISDILPLVKPVNDHKWKGCKPGMVLPSDEYEIEKLLDDCKSSLDTLKNTINKVCESGSIHHPLTLREIESSISAAKVVAASKPIDKEVLLNQEWNELSNKAKLLIKLVDDFQSQSSALHSKFRETAFEQDIESIFKEYKELSAKFVIIRLFNSRYRYLKKEISSFYKGIAPKNTESVILDLHELSACVQSRKQIRDLHESGLNLFGSHWKDEESNPQMLDSFAEWIVSFRQQLLKNTFNNQVVDKISSGVSKGELEKAIEDASIAVGIFVEHRDKLFSRINLDYEQVFGTNADSVYVENIDSKLRLWKEGVSELQKWSQFTVRREHCLETFAAPIINLIDSDLLESDDIIPCFEGNFADELLRCAFMERQTLASFMGELHEKKIKTFTELDRELILENRQRLAYLLYEKQPSIPKGVSPKSEAGILLGEFNRKRNHMPIRKLIKNAGGLIQKIKPCFMMSPLSIAQFLDPLNVNFDIVVFDEASQVRPEDALGALLRANQCVIIGDTRQLPPTSFFDKIVDSIDNYDDENTTSLSDIESILHLCKRSFLTKNLRWHYRSRHESLIAVSNQEFYDQNLVIYPSPIADMEHLGLKFVHLPDTIYDRGKTSTNRKEAKAVAQAALEHFAKYPDKSLGIGTFNIKQQQAILEEVEMLLIQNPDMTEFFETKRPDHFFVKNLETIQGDERDVIFISVGFGFDRDNKLSLNFGPLNREGGERRLNVLITRAREKCVVFSNFKASDLAITPTIPFGLRSLKVFLDFAENRNLHSIGAIGEDSDSPFEESVYEFLRDCGYDVQKQVGCAGYRIDLAIVDPKYPGRYLLGIECDGAKYHSSRVARDRDRLRQQILENLGWTIYRIWSTDWYRNKKDCQIKLRETIEKAKMESPKPTITPKSTLEKPVQIMDSGVEREDSSKCCVSNEESLLDLVSEYQTCSTIDIDTQTQIHELPRPELERAITQILKIESPVHIDELIKRIRENHGLKRSGQKIKNAILEAVNYSEKNGKLTKRGDFLWLDINDVKIRRRGNGVPAKVEMICNEEIAEAAKLVLKNQHATSPDELVVQTSRLFGIRSTSGMTVERIKGVINEMIGKNDLKVLPNGMVDLVE